MFDDLQKKAVEYYKSSPVAKATNSVPGTKFGSSSAGGVATPMPDAVQTLEADLEVCARKSSLRVCVCVCVPPPVFPKDVR